MKYIFFFIMSFIIPCFQSKGDIKVDLLRTYEGNGFWVQGTAIFLPYEASLVCGPDVVFRKALDLFRTTVKERMSHQEHDWEHGEHKGAHGILVEMNEIIKYIGNLEDIFNGGKCDKACKERMWEVDLFILSLSPTKKDDCETLYCNEFIK